MNAAIKQYIDYNMDLHGEAVYGKPTWIGSAVDGGVMKVIIPVNRNELTKAILVHQISYGWSGANLSQITLSDEKYPNIPIWRVIASTGLTDSLPSGFANFTYYSEGPSLTLVTDHTRLVFSILYQKITQKKKKQG